jgi:hypothetical protein
MSLLPLLVLAPIACGKSGLVGGGSLPSFPGNGTSVTPSVWQFPGSTKTQTQNQMPSDSHDATNGVPIAGNAPNGITPTIFVNNFSLEFQRNDYQIDNFLSLTILHKMRLTVSPKVVYFNPDGTEASGQSEYALPPGKYRLLLVLLDGNKNEPDLNKRYLSASEATADLTEGELIADLTMNFGYDSLWARSAMTEIAIQIIPVTPATGTNQLAVPTYSGALQPGDGTAAPTLLRTTYTAADVIASASIAQAEKKKQLVMPASGADLFASSFNMVNLNTNKEFQRILSVSQADIDKLVADPTSQAYLASKLCNYFYFPRYQAKKNAPPPAGLLAACLKKPLSKLLFSERVFVTKVTNPDIAHDVATVGMTVNAGLSLSANLSNSTTSGNSDTKSKATSLTTTKGISMSDSAWASGSVSADGGFNLFGTGVKASASAGVTKTVSSNTSIDVSSTWSDSKAQYVSNDTTSGTGQSNSLSIGISKTLTINAMQIEFEAKTRKCFVIQSQERLADMAAGIRVPNNKPNGEYEYKPSIPLYVCASSETVENQSEDFYYIAEDSGNTTAFHSSMDNDQTPLSLLIRGKDRFDAFTRAMSDSSKQIMLKQLSTEVPVLNESSIVIRQAFSQYLNQDFPGMLTAPVN